MAACSQDSVFLMTACLVLFMIWVLMMTHLCNPDSAIWMNREHAVKNLIFQEKLCQYVPNGGEVTVDNEYNDLDNAITDLSQMHVSYLNSEHDADSSG